MAKTPINTDHGAGPAPEQHTGAGLQRQSYLTVPPEALIAYHVPPNVLAPT